ncbi:MAG: hypothetical protein WC695_02985 [Candidatus Omnitrophota bacterium]
MATVYLPLNNKFYLKVQADTRHILRRLITFYVTTFWGRPLALAPEGSVDFVLKLKSPRRLNPNHAVETGLSVSVVPAENPDEYILLLETAYGSRVTIDYRKRNILADVGEQDPFAEYLLLRSMMYVSRFSRMLRIHASAVQRRNCLALFIGKSGEGKSAISNAASCGNPQWRKLAEDCSWAFEFSGRQYLFVPELFDFQPITHLFFLEKQLTGESAVNPMRKKEAFRQLISNADISLKKNDPLKDARLEVLRHLAENTKPFSLINGKGLKDDPSGLRNLLKQAGI